MSFFDGATLDFTSIQSRLSATLRYHNVGLNLELLRGLVETTTHPGLSRKILGELSQKPKNACSIGVGGNTIEARWLGGYLQFNPRNGPPTKVGIICHHVVAPGLDKDPKTIE